MTTAFASSPHGQNHDRIHDKNDLTIPLLPTEDDMSGHADPAEITTIQKMLSATTGSLLTGLTSMYYHSIPVYTKEHMSNYKQ